MGREMGLQLLFPFYLLALGLQDDSCSVEQKIQIMIVII
jgi:hypothetical protein